MLQHEAAAAVVRNERTIAFKQRSGPISPSAPVLLIPTPLPFDHDDHDDDDDDVVAVVLLRLSEQSVRCTRQEGGEDCIKASVMKSNEAGILGEIQFLISFSCPRNGTAITGIRLLFLLFPRSPCCLSFGASVCVYTRSPDHSCAQVAVGKRAIHHLIICSDSRAHTIHLLSSYSRE